MVLHEAYMKVDYFRIKMKNTRQQILKMDRHLQQSDTTTATHTFPGNYPLFKTHQVTFIKVHVHYVLYATVQKSDCQ